MTDDKPDRKLSVEEKLREDLNAKQKIIENLRFNEKLSSKEKFQIALETRNFEIDMLWRRSNYFLLLNTSVAIGAGTVAIEGGYGLFIFACIIGMCVCYAWRGVFLGAKFWQCYWEQVVVDLQDSVGLEKIQKHNFFSHPANAKHIKWRVMRALNNTKYSKIRKGHILGKRSVSGWMYETSELFLGVWFIAFAYALFCFCASKIPDYREFYCLVCLMPSP